MRDPLKSGHTETERHMHQSSSRPSVPFLTPKTSLGYIGTSTSLELFICTSFLFNFFLVWSSFPDFTEQCCLPAVIASVCIVPMPHGPASQAGSSSCSPPSTPHMCCLPPRTSSLLPSEMKSQVNPSFFTSSPQLYNSHCVQ